MRGRVALSAKFPDVGVKGAYRAINVSEHVLARWLGPLERRGKRGRSERLSDEQSLAVKLSPPASCCEPLIDIGHSDVARFEDPSLHCSGVVPPT